MFDEFLRKRFVVLHGEGAPHQADVYRCYNCHRLVTHKKIAVGDVCCAGRMVPTNPSWTEKVRLFLFPWTV